VTLTESRQEMAAIAAGVQVKGWGSESRSLGMIPLKEELVGDSARALKLLLAGALNREIRAAAPDLPMSDDIQKATPMQELVRRSLAAPRFSAMLISAFSATALLLSRWVCSDWWRPRFRSDAESSGYGRHWEQSPGI